MTYVHRESGTVVEATFTNMEDDYSNRPPWILLNSNVLPQSNDTVCTGFNNFITIDTADVGDIYWSRRLGDVAVYENQAAFNNEHFVI